MNTSAVKNHYNTQLKGKYKDYEKERWFKNKIQEAWFKMTKSAVLRHADPTVFKTCFELGPGHGTWSQILIDAHRNAKFDLVDISEEMLKLSKERFNNKNNIRYFESDFLEFKPDKKYDFFFSSRAIEYIPEKEKVVKKIVDLLLPGGKGVIITKTPKYLRNKIMGRKEKDIHKGQIDPARLSKLFASEGCKEIEIYPVTMVFPLLSSPRLNMLLYSFFGKKKLNFLSKLFSESYIIKLNKAV